MHHPWRAFRDLAHVRLFWADLPDGLLGLTDFRNQAVTLTRGMTQAERRCTIAHETEHLVRGPVPAHLEAREERAVDAAVARRLITFDALAEALVWAGDDHELAEELWVDVATVRARLEALSAEESDELVARLEAAELRNP